MGETSSAAAGLPALDPNLASLLYLVSGVLFILALRGLSSPETSRQGNNYGMIGMAVAIGTTLLMTQPDMTTIGIILAGLVVGGGVGAYLARNIQMTQMPQLVAAFHSLVGLAAVAVAAAALNAPRAPRPGAAPPPAAPRPAPPPPRRSARAGGG